MVSFGYYHILERSAIYMTFNAIFINYNNYKFYYAQEIHKPISDTHFVEQRDISSLIMELKITTK